MACDSRALGALTTTQWSGNERPSWLSVTEQCCPRQATEPQLKVEKLPAVSPLVSGQMHVYAACNYQPLRVTQIEDSNFMGLLYGTWTVSVAESATVAANKLPYRTPGPVQRCGHHPFRQVPLIIMA
jgi:hypothetical protein